MRALGETLTALAAFLIIAAVHAQDDADPYQTVRDICRNRLGLTEEEVAEGKNNAEPLKCYILCYLQELAVFDAMGNFDPELALGAIQSEMREASTPGVYKCHQEFLEFTDPCEHAYDIVNCFAQSSPEIYEVLNIFAKPTTT